MAGPGEGGSASEMPQFSGFGMTDLEEALRAPGGAELGRELLERLGSLQSRIKAEMASGLPPDLYQTSEAVRKALSAAYDIIAHFPKPDETAGSR